MKSGGEIRRHPDSNWGIKVLQTSALPLGYAAAKFILHELDLPWSSQGWHVYTELDRLLTDAGDKIMSWHRLLALNELTGFKIAKTVFSIVSTKCGASCIACIFIYFFWLQ